MAKKHLIIIIC